MIPVYFIYLLSQIEINPAMLYVYGPLGVMNAFFMIMSIRLLALGARHVEDIKNANSELRQDLIKLSHRFAGLERALLADMVERDTTGINTKKYCREAMARIDALVNT